MKMELTSALFVSLLIFIFILMFAYGWANIRFWSSLALASILSLVILLLLYPVYMLVAEKSCWEVVLYGLLILFFVVTTILYVFSMSVRDRKKCD